MYEMNAFSDDEEEIPRRPKIIRPRINHFEEYDDHDFFVRFRLTKESVHEILELIRENIKHPTNRNDCLTPDIQLLLTLRFYATGSFLSTAADFVGVSKATASIVVRRVSIALANLRHIYIQMPQTEDEMNNEKKMFFEIARFPRCVGAIDCTHVKIQSPGGENAEVFRNRKQFFSLNVQTIANANLEIKDIVGRWPGSAHDSHILRNSHIFANFTNGNFGNSVLVGDKGYPIKPFLLTPLREVHNEREQLYNESQIRTRNVVERSYGIWKRRFPCLAMGLRLKVDTVQAVIVATAVLHNIARRRNEELPPVNEEEVNAINFVNNVAAAEIQEVRNGRNNITRLDFVNNYFGNL